MTIKTTTAKSTSVPWLTPAHLSFVSATLFLVLLASLHVIEPEFAPSWRFVSEYALGAYGWLMALAFFALALSAAALRVAVKPYVTTIGGKIGLGLLLLVALALVAAGLFPQDPITARPDELTTRGNLHALAAMIGIPGFPLAALLISWSLTRHHRAWFSARRSVLGAAHLTWLSLVAMFVYIGLTLPQAGGFGPGVSAGWFNRLVVVAECAWLMTVAWHTIKLRYR